MYCILTNLEVLGLLDDLGLDSRFNVQRIGDGFRSDSIPPSSCPDLKEKEPRIPGSGSVRNQGAILSEK